MYTFLILSLSNNWIIVIIIVGNASWLCSVNISSCCVQMSYMYMAAIYDNNKVHSQNQVNWKCHFISQKNIHAHVQNSCEAYKWHNVHIISDTCVCVHKINIHKKRYPLLSINLLIMHPGFAQLVEKLTATECFHQMNLLKNVPFSWCFINLAEIRPEYLYHLHMASVPTTVPTEKCRNHKHHIW